MPEAVTATLGVPVVGARDLERELRGGVRHWLRSYLLMVRWEVLNQRLELPLIVVLQLMLGAGMALGFGLLFDSPGPVEALYLSTGATVIPMLIVGLVVLPQQIAQQKILGTYEYLFGLPMPRMAMYFAGLTVWSLIAIPSAVVALLTAAWRYDLALDVSPLVIPATMLTVGVGAAVGYAFAHGLPNPRLTNVLTQLLIFVVVMFSPINFPAERLPDWMAAIHAWMPAEHAAVVMRGTLTDGLVDGGLGGSFAILGAWAVGSWALTAWVINRRG